MNSDQQVALAQTLIGWGDDELLLGHRDSEWTGHAPILEEDIAFGNIALDELGHAVNWYQLAAELLGQDPVSYPDYLVYQRPVSEFRNVQLVELPKGDWAFTIVRQYLFDSAETARLEQLSQGSYPPLADRAAKIRTEELYHMRHLRAWVERLGLGTDESQQRMQRALDDLYARALQLFTSVPAEAELVADRVLPDPAPVKAAWEQEVLGQFERSSLVVPAAAAPPAVDRSQHTEHLGQLVGELQEVARQHAGARW